MWSNLTTVGGVTDTVTLPADGIVSVAIPPGIELCAYVNNAISPMHHLHVKQGDTLYFKLESHSKVPATIPIQYNGSTYNLIIEPKLEKEHRPIIGANVEKPSIIEDTIIAPITTEPTIPKEENMSDVPEINNIFKTAPAMGDGGYGMGGLAAMIPLLALTGGLGGRRNDTDCGAEKVAVMNAGFDGINHNINNLGVGVNHNINTALQGITQQVNTGFGAQRDLDVMQKLGSIEGDIWKAEGQVQLAVAGATSEINNRIADSMQIAMAGQSAIRKDVSDATASVLASNGQLRQEVATSAAVNQATTLNAKYELSQNIRDDGDKTRALITRQYEDTLNRQLAVAQDALIEQRSFARQREVEVNVTQNVNQNQAQLQAQQQQQQQFLVTNNLLQAILCQAQVAQATNQSLIIGNTGAVVGGPQNANPTNVRA